MPWNQPGSNGDKDPWGRKEGRRDGPPDLDEIFKHIKDRLNKSFGGKHGGDGVGSSLLSGSLISLALLIAALVWGISGVYTVEADEEAVELVFGKYQETKSPGLRWHWPYPIETAILVKTRKLNTVEVGYRTRNGSSTLVPSEALMLSEDENILDVRVAVQYDIKDPIKLLFQVSEYRPHDIAATVIRQATESALREVIGHSTMDFAVTRGRGQLAQETQTLLQSILDRYGTGINIRAIELQEAAPPIQVKPAFDEAVEAREDRERFINLAKAYAKSVIPKARGSAARLVQEAKAYKASIVAKAEGEASRFNQVLAEYQKATEITRDRLYIETMEQVLSNSSKMVIDQKNGNSVMYLPLDQMLKNKSTRNTDVGDLSAEAVSSRDNQGRLNVRGRLSERASERRVRATQ